MWWSSLITDEWRTCACHAAAKYLSPQREPVACSPSFHIPELPARSMVAATATANPSVADVVAGGLRPLERFIHAKTSPLVFQYHPQSTPIIDR